MEQAKEVEQVEQVGKAREHASEQVKHAQAAIYPERTRYKYFHSYLSWSLEWLYYRPLKNLSRCFDGATALG